MLYECHGSSSQRCGPGIIRRQPPLPSPTRSAAWQSVPSHSIEGQMHPFAARVRPRILCTRGPPGDFRLGGMTLHQHGVAGLESSEATTETVPAGDDRRRAGTFFLGWLILAASMSLSGNVGHALLIAPSETRWLAALAALVPPTVLLAATHSATWLVRARSVGWVYWVALALTAALALGSFALSFDALRSFAVMLGIRQSMSWIWPAVIDVAIAHATLCLLSLTRPKRVKTSHAVETKRAATTSATSTNIDGYSTQSETEQMVEDLPQPPPPNSLPLSVARTSEAPAGPTPNRESYSAYPSATGPAAVRHGHPPTDSVAAGQRPLERALSAVPAAMTSVRPASEQCAETGAESTVERWQPMAESLVREGITTKDPDLIAKILADNAAGTPPSTIGRRHEIHHTTVNRILSAAEQLAETSSATG